ncbi:MAG: calcium-binding protein [Patescibacteria group bacterium]
MDSNMKKILGVIGAIVIVGGVAEIAMHQNGANATPTTPSTPTDSGSNGSSAPPVAANYKDGTYTADGDYQTHETSETVHISITLKDNVITDSTFQATPNASLSAYFQGLFSQNYKAMIIGQNINDVHLTKVSGSSLTPGGFDAALEKIKAQAQA